MAKNYENLFVLLLISYAVILSANQTSGDEDQTEITIYQSKNQKFLVYRNAIKHECYIESVAETSADQSQTSKTLFVGKSEITPSHEIFAELGRDVIDMCKGFAILRLEWQPFTKHTIKRRQVNSPKQSYFKGQTQTQFISFDDGKNKDEKAGLAEAIAEQDKSRATVQGRMGMGQAQSQSASGDPCVECAAAGNPQLQGTGQAARTFDNTKPTSFVPSNGAINAVSQFSPPDVHFGEPTAPGYRTQPNLYNSPHASAPSAPSAPNPFDPFNTVGPRNYQFPNGQAASQTPSFANILPGFHTTNEPGSRYVPNLGATVGSLEPSRGQTINPNVATGPNQPPYVNTPARGENFYPGQNVGNQQGILQSIGGSTPAALGSAVSPPYMGQTTRGDVSNQHGQPTAHLPPNSALLYPQQGSTVSQSGDPIYSQNPVPAAGTYVSGEPLYGAGGAGGVVSTGYRPTSGIPSSPDGSSFNAASVVPWSPATGVINPQPALYHPVTGMDGFPSVYNQQAIPTPRVPHVTATYSQHVAQPSQTGGAAFTDGGIGASQGGTPTYLTPQVSQTQYPSSVSQQAGQTPAGSPQRGGQTSRTDAFEYPDARTIASHGAIPTYPPHTTQTLYPQSVGYPVGGQTTITYPQQGVQTSPNNVITYPQHQSFIPGGGSTVYPRQSAMNGNTAANFPQHGSYPAQSGFQFGTSPQGAPTPTVSHFQQSGGGGASTYFPQTNTVSSSLGENQRNLYGGGGQISPTETNYRAPYGGGQTDSAASNVNYPSPTGTGPISTSLFPLTTYDVGTNFNNQRGPQPTLISTGIPTSTSNAGQIQGGEKGVDVSRGSEIVAVDTAGGESQSSSSINVNGNDTKAAASAQGKTRTGKAQAQVSGTYSGSFSAQAQTSDDEKSVESQIFGNSSGALSSSQGRAGKSGSQSQIRYSYETGASVAEAQGSGINFNTNSQIQAGNKGGIADAQSTGSGSTASQAQIGFLPFDGKTDQLSIFEGGGTSSAQSSAFSGQSQSQFQGSFKLGSSFVGSAQSSAGKSQNATKLAFNSTSLSLLNAKQDLKQETGQQIETLAKPSPDGEVKKFASVKKPNDKNNNNNDVIKFTEPVSPPARNDNVDRSPQNDQHTIVSSTVNEPSSYQDQDAFVKSEKYDAYIYKDSIYGQTVPSSVLNAGEIVPDTGTQPYKIPKGFRGKIASSAGDITQTVATTSGRAQTQTVKLTPGAGRVTIEDHGNQAVQNEVIVYGDDQTKLSNCGYFSFTCNLIHGSKGRTKICKPGPLTYADGTPCSQKIFTK